MSENSNQDERGTNPFLGYMRKGYDQGYRRRAVPAKSRENGRKDGTPRNRRGRTVLVPLHLEVDPALLGWLQDRAAVLGVPYTTFCRDVLATFRALVRMGEKEAGESYDVQEDTPDVLIPERLPGYVAHLVPRGLMRSGPSHLDDSPLTLEEN